MSTDIVQFKGENGSLVTITPEDVKRQLCPQATEKEVFMFLELCKAHRLNPWIGDVYLIKYGDNPAQMQAGKEAFTKRAAANPDFEGFEAGITILTKSGQLVQREGSAVYPAIGETLVGGWARVYISGKKPFFDEVALSEYHTGRSLWKTKPATMIRKVALVHTLREAFPDDFAGLYSSEEMPDGPTETQARPAQAARVENATEALPDVQGDDDRQASAKDLKIINGMIDELADIRQVERQTVSDAVFKSKKMVDAGFDGDAVHMTDRQAKVAMTMLQRWLKTARKKAEAEAVEAEDAEQAEPDYETD